LVYPAVQTTTKASLQYMVAIIWLNVLIREPFEEFVDWRQCAAVMQREVVTVMPNCNGGDNVMVVWSSFL
jgi:hypothetical protein